MENGNGSRVANFQNFLRKTLGRVCSYISPINCGHIPMEEIEQLDDEERTIVRSLNKGRAIEYVQICREKREAESKFDKLFNQLLAQCSNHPAQSQAITQETANE